jgi:hypothetical protein
MPMIDIYAAAGTLPDIKKLATDAAALVKSVEQVPDIPVFRKNTAAFVHEMLTNAGALDRDKQIALVGKLTDLIAEAAPGGWGLWGHAQTNEELVSAARAEIGRLRR